MHLKSSSDYPKEKLEFSEEKYLMLFTEASLQGAASQLAARHDFKPEVIAKHAVAVAKAAIEELKKNG